MYYTLILPVWESRWMSTPIRLGVSSGRRCQIRGKHHRPSTCLGAGPHLALTRGNDRDAHQHLLATPDARPKRSLELRRF